MNSNNDIKNNKIKKNKIYKKKCNVCKKKLSQIERLIICKCKIRFCSEHRISENHNCNFNYKEAHQNILKKNNPLVEFRKLLKI